MDPAFTCPPGYQCLQAIIQTITNTCKNQVIYTRDAGHGKGLGTIMTKENIIGNKIQLRNQYGKTDWQGDFQDLPVSDR